MRWHKGWQTASLFGIMALCLTSISPIPLAIAQAQAQTQSSTPIPDCTEQRGQIIEQLTRELIYRSQQYARSGQFNLAARSLDQALKLVPTVEDPFTKTDLVANIAGETGEQPSTMEQIIAHAIATQQLDIPLALLPNVANATQTLNGEYGAINLKRAVFIRLAQHYTVIDQPDAARSQLDQARQLLDSLHGDGFGLIAAPVANGYAALGDNEPAIAILDQALQRTEAMTTNDQGYLSYIFSPIATAYAKAGATQQALQVVQQIQVTDIKASTLVAIASHFTQASSSTQVTQILAQAQDLTQTLSPDLQPGILSQMALAYARVGQWDTALNLIDRIASAETKIRTLGTLASLSDRANRPSETTKLLDKITAIAQTVVPFYDGDTVLRQISTDYLANRQYELAIQFSQTLDATLQDELLLKLTQEASIAGEFAIALNAAATLAPGWQNQTRSLALQSVATGYAQAGQYADAIQLLPQIGNTSAYPTQVLTRVAIAQSYRKAGQFTPAIAQLHQALQSLQTLDSSVETLQALSLIAVQFAQLGQPDRAIEVQTQALDMAKTLDPNASFVASVVEKFLSQYLQAEEYTLALQLAQTPENMDQQDYLRRIVLQQLFEVGDLPSVLQAADGIHNPNQKIAVWVKLSDYYRGMGEVEPAVAILAQAFAIAQTLTGPDQISYPQLDPSVPGWEDEFDRGSLIEAIAIRYAELRQYDVAHQTAQALRSPTDRNRLMQRLACYQ